MIHELAKQIAYLHYPLGKGEKHERYKLKHLADSIVRNWIEEKVRELDKATCYGGGIEGLRIILGLTEASEGLKEFPLHECMFVDNVCGTCGNLLQKPASECKHGCSETQYSVLCSVHSKAYGPGSPSSDFKLPQGIIEGLKQFKKESPMETCSCTAFNAWKKYEDCDNWKFCPTCGGTAPRPAEKRKKLWEILHDAYDYTAPNREIKFGNMATAAVEEFERIINAQEDRIEDHHERVHSECPRCIEISTANHKLDELKRRLREMV